ncbi:MAG: GAF domain-containing sensor histidine kinase [Spirulinaceae cyanobacterium SM2_1_0]|nr:GAF domain-containing sensor histidine kinase [Spirulinaceae cyanobacterium SM2_1_0]
MADSREAADRAAAELQAAQAALTCQVVLTLAAYQDHLAVKAWDVILVCQLPRPNADPLALPLHALERLQAFQAAPPAVLWTSPLGDRATITCLQAGFSDCVLSTHSQQLAVALWQAVGQADRQRQDWQLLHIGRLVTAMQAAPDADASLGALLQSLRESLQSRYCLLLQPDTTSGQLTVRQMASGDREVHAAVSHELATAAQVVQTQLAQGDILHWLDCDVLATQPVTVQHITQLAGRRALVFLPLPGLSTHLSVLAVYDCPSPRAWQLPELALIDAAAHQVAQVLRQIQLEQQLRDRQQQAVSRQQFARLEEENRIKSELLSTMSHELRAPLTGILGFARMLHEQIYGKLNEKQMQYVGAIASSGEYLRSLIDDLLDLSRIEAQREEIYPEPLVLEEVCLAVLGMVQSQAELKGLDLCLDLAPEVTTCKADRRRLQQILINLLANAIKFTETGSVTLAVSQTAQQVEFAVADTGIGIATPDCDRLFRPFSQIHNHLQRKYKGTGLGLKLSRELARLHGGDIRVESQPDKGSTFTVSLPLEPPVNCQQNLTPPRGDGV